ncbi:protein pinocchio isoform X1 [Musca domestica]|uniref:Protein pinocchio isoform X1 n=2 Tax=Musca domestica TaxID=7370 RepID=A0A9J7I1G7_MUSDO|nr:protein pinocchio isoform X1 [Musca domestica]
MKSRPISASSNIVTEWEDSVLFDADDPDFCNVNPNVNNVLNNSGNTAAAGLMLPPPPPPPLLGAISNGNGGLVSSFNFKATTMSLASVQGPQFTDICPLGRTSLSMSSSLSDLVGSPLEISMDNVLTIEELRQHMGSCFTCGVSWTDDHVSLDCSECGGYSVERPCPLCDGQCGVQWKRDFTMSHACGKARWLGVCPTYPEAAAHFNATTSATTTITNACNPSAASCAAAAATQMRLATELCARLEQLSASAGSSTNHI